MNLIVAVSENYGIGKNNSLLFHLPADLKYFKEKTTGRVVIMGEKTYFSLPKRPLPNRTTIVLSGSPSFNEDGIIIVRSLKELLEKVKAFNKEDVFVCGGASVYNLLLDYCDKAYITKIYKTTPADTFIKNIEALKNWEEISSSEVKEENGLKFCFKVFKNNNVKEN